MRLRFSGWQLNWNRHGHGKIAPRLFTVGTRRQVSDNLRGIRANLPFFMKFTQLGLLWLGTFEGLQNIDIGMIYSIHPGFLKWE
jgi:hypothetical protein